jgi:eukaryotic-like serine/threonine-protein kinase
LAETSPHGRLHLMRSYCKLSDAELALGNGAMARQYADAALPSLNEFKVTSPSLLVLRDIGFCYESEGAVQHHRAVELISSPPQSVAAEGEALGWYRKSADAWMTWDARGAATPESERERRKVERLLDRQETSLQQQALTKTSKRAING